MRKGLVVLAVSAIVAFVAPAGASAKNFECNTAFLTGVIDGNVIVPKDAFCRTLGATIIGSVLVQEGAVGFHAHTSTIVGHVYSERPIVFDIRILDSNVGGNVHISRTSAGSMGAICRSNIGTGPTTRDFRRSESGFRPTCARQGTRSRVASS